MLRTENLGPANDYEIRGAWECECVNEVMV